jgi:hypothetical protein
LVQNRSLVVVMRSAAGREEAGTLGLLREQSLNRIWEEDQLEGPVQEWDLALLGNVRSTAVQCQNRRG